MFWGFPWVSLVAQSVKNLPAVQETLLQYLGWEDLLEKEMANPLQYPCLENLMDTGVWWAAVHGVTESGTTEQLTLTYRTAPLAHDKIEQDVFLKCRP